MFKFFIRSQKKKKKLASLPIEFPDGKTPVCTKMYIYMGKSLNQIIKVPTFASEKFRNLKYYYELVTVRVFSLIPLPIYIIEFILFYILFDSLYYFFKRVNRDYTLNLEKRH